MTTNTKSELDAIRTGAAIYPLTDRAFLRITGADATRWLNGMVTNNIAALAPGEGNYNFLLNAQGRIQGDCTIYRIPDREPDAYLLESDKSQIHAIHKHLDHFIIMDDVVLTYLEQMTGVGIVGYAARRLAFELWDIEPKSTPESGPLGELRVWPLRNCKQTFLYPPSPSHSQLTTVEIWSTDPQEIDARVTALNTRGATRISPSALEAFRILSGVPKFGVDITEKYLPQETAQTHALHFSKGCYLGQEIVERIHSRGQVHRTFTQFTLEGELPTLPTPLESNGKPAGELTSAALIDGIIYALGYARREFLETNQPLTYPGGTATPSTAPKLITTH